MPAPPNPLKPLLAREAVLRGLWLNLGSARVAEIAARAGFDWVLIDGEHAPYDITAIEAQLRALEGAGARPVVRVPWRDDWILKQVLDLGVQTVMVPMIDTVEAAKAAVRACRYPPAGVRGQGALVARAGLWGGIPDYPGSADAEIAVIAQAESRAALDNIEAIAAVDGIDAIFIGPADLAADMGYLADPMNAEVLAAIEAAVPRIRAAGVGAGIIVRDPAFRARLVARGLNILGHDSDAAILFQGLKASAEER